MATKKTKASTKKPSSVGKTNAEKTGDTATRTTTDKPTEEKVVPAVDDSSRYWRRKNRQKRRAEATKRNRPSA